MGVLAGLQSVGWTRHGSRTDAVSGSNMRCVQDDSCSIALYAARKARACQICTALACDNICMQIMSACLMHAFTLSQRLAAKCVCYSSKWLQLLRHLRSMSTALRLFSRSSAASGDK